MADGRLVLASGPARLIVSPADGGRFSSLVVDGHELLVTEGYGPIRWGCYPMVPFAGRIRDGRFAFRGRAVELPLNLPPHAIHGTVFERPWEVLATPDHSLRLGIDLGPDWPFPGRVEQAIEVRDDGLSSTLTVTAEEPMPVVVGWHPWFRWSVGGAGASLSFEPGRMVERSPDGLPTGRLVEPKPRPWDDAFVELAAPPRVGWPGVLSLELEADVSHWVVYDETSDGLCVEPQTGPPDAVNQPDLGGAAVVEPGQPFTRTMTWRWSRPG
jgi:aldose 1-epimerase